MPTLYLETGAGHTLALDPATGRYRLIPRPKD